MNWLLIGRRWCNPFSLSRQDHEIKWTHEVVALRSQGVTNEGSELILRSRYSGRNPRG